MKLERQGKVIFTRINILFTIVFFFFAALIIRLAFVQIVNGEEYEKTANDRSINRMLIQAPRGKIYDKNGQVLVDNKVSFTAVFREEDWMTKEYILELAQKTSSILGMTNEEIIKRLDPGFDHNGTYMARKEPKFIEKDIKFDLENKEIATIAENRTELKGIGVSAKPIRKYDDERVAVQTIGYVRPFGVAKTLPATEKFYNEKDTMYDSNQYVGIDGIELSYEEVLKGENGYKDFRVDARGNLKEELSVTKPIPGSDLYLSFDKRVQLESQKFIADYVNNLRFHPRPQVRQVKTAYAVAIETETGKIAAMVSHPDYDPSVWIKGVDQKTYEDIQFSINNGTIRSAPYDPRPKPIEEIQKHPRSIVPIGSTIKPITVLMGLNEGIISTNDRWRDAVSYTYGRGGDKIRNAGRRDLGWLTPQLALQKSSNTYMARIADEMVKKGYSVETFQDYFHDFGLGNLTEVDLPFESSGVEDFIDTSKNVSTLAALVQASFGQQGRYTAMQIAQFGATLANNGKRLKPQLVDRVKNGDEIEYVESEILNEVKIPDPYWDVVHQGMTMVTQPGGTAVFPFRGFPYSIASKTGTSQQDIYANKKRFEIESSTFVGYAPADKPKLAVAVVVPEGGYASNAASYIARGIFDIYDKYVGLES